MLHKVSVLILASLVGLTAKIWVNAIRDPGAELGQGDWQADIWEFPEGYGIADSAYVNAHDSTRAFESEYSLRTDTEKNPGIDGGKCNAYCYQHLVVPKAVRDLDSCEWTYYVDYRDPQFMFRFDISFRTGGGKTLLWYGGNKGYDNNNDTLYLQEFFLPDSGEWRSTGSNLREVWVNLAKWSESDTIFEVSVCSRGWESIYYHGQDVSWDNIYLASVAYYDYAAESIDSDSGAEYAYTPVVTFANEGIKDDKDAWVYAEILEGINRIYVDSQQVSIPKESSEQVTFAEWSVPHDGSYTLRAYPVLDLDELSSDDTLAQTLTGTAVTEQPGAQAISLEVSSFAATPKITYSLPSGQSGTISIFDAAGRKLESLKVRGLGEVKLPSELSSGVYFVKLEAENGDIIRKVVVVK